MRQQCLYWGWELAVFASNTEIAGRGAGFATNCLESGYCTDHMDGDNDGICDDCQYDLGSLDTGRHHNSSCYYNKEVLVLPGAEMKNLLTLAIRN